MSTTFDASLARRRLDHEWPAELRELWHAAQALRHALDTLEAAEAMQRGRSFFDAIDAAASAISHVEALAAPLLLAADAAEAVTREQRASLAAGSA